MDGIVDWGYLEHALVHSFWLSASLYYPQTYKGILIVLVVVRHVLQYSVSEEEGY